MLRAALAITGKDLRQRLRDRSAVVLGFVAPLLIATIMNAAFGGSQDLHATLVVADEDHGPVAAALVAALGSPELRDVVTVHAATDEVAARRAVDAGDADAGLVIPSGFSAGVTAAGGLELVVLADVDSPVAAEIARSIARSYAARLAAVRLSVAAAVDAGAPHERVQELVAAAMATEPPMATVELPAPGRRLEGVAYYAPGMAIFFVLFAIGFTARSWFVEAREGTLDRVRAAPVWPEAVLVGKALSVFVYSLASLLTVSLVAGTIFGASWGSPAGVVALCTGMSAAVVGLSALVMSVARNERQSDTLANALTFTLALVGGSFVFLGTAPALLRRLAALTPNGQALRGFTDLATGAPVGDAVVRPLAGMLAFAVATGAVAVVATRRSAR